MEIVQNPENVQDNIVTRLTHGGRKYRGQPTLSELKHENRKIKLINQETKILTLDEVTGLPTKALFLREAQRYIHGAYRKAEPFALLFLDVDDLKNINDNCGGHLVGDAALKVVADSLRDSIRESDLLGRYGGDEFIFILTNYEKNESKKGLALRYQERVEENILMNNKLDNVPSIKVSTGAEIYRGRQQQLTLDQLINNADVQMYKEKSTHPKNG